MRLLQAFGGAEDLLCFASGYPHWNSDSAASVAERLPASWHAKVFHDNARSWFRWPGASRAPRVSSAAPPVVVGAMPVVGDAGAGPAQRTYETEDGRELDWTPASD